MHKNFNVVKGKKGEISTTYWVLMKKQHYLVYVYFVMEVQRMYDFPCSYVPISWIISQLNALGKNWFPLLQTTSLMRVSFRAPADTITHHQTQRKYDECSNNTCHHKTEGMRRRSYNSLMRGNMPNVFMTSFMTNHIIIMNGVV